MVFFFYFAETSEISYFHWLANFFEANQKLFHKFEIIKKYKAKKLSLTGVKSNKIFHHTRCITLKRVTSLRGPFSRHCAEATKIFLKKCRSDGRPLATVCPIRPVRDLNLRLFASETSVLLIKR